MPFFLSNPVRRLFIDANTRMKIHKIPWLYAIFKMIVHMNNTIFLYMIYNTKENCTKIKKMAVWIPAIVFICLLTIISIASVE